MLKNSILTISLLGSATGCTTINHTPDRNHDDPHNIIFENLDYCWSENHFLSVDMDRSDLIQMVNDDLILYTISGDPTSIYCAYPTHNDEIINIAKKKGLRYYHRRVVFP